MGKTTYMIELEVVDGKPVAGTVTQGDRILIAVARELTKTVNGVETTYAGMIVTATNDRLYDDLYLLLHRLLILNSGH